MDPLNGHRSSAHRNHRKLLLFCQHPVAQERFVRLLSKAGFEVRVNSELRLPGSEAGRPALLAVVDCSDMESSLEFIRGLRLQHCQLPVLVLLPKLHGAQSYAFLRVGVKGMLAYNQAQRELARAASQVAAGGYCIPREILTGFIESILPELFDAATPAPEIEISRREREVLGYLLKNLSNKEIAAKLFVSERTVKFHVSNLLSKFGVARRADLIVLWMRRATVPWHLREQAEPLSVHVN